MTMTDFQQRTTHLGEGFPVQRGFGATHLFPILVMAMIFTAAAVAQDRDVSTVTLAEFIERADRVKKEPRLSSIEQIIDEAISSGRVEFMTVCFEEFGDSSAFKDKLSALPPSRFKNKLVLSIMQEHWTYDDDRAGSRPYPAMHRICIEVIKDYLPAENLSSDDEADVDRLDRYARRLVVARRFRDALEAAGEIKPVSRPDRKPPPFGKAAETGRMHSSKPPDSPEARADPKMPLDKRIPFLIAAAAVMGFLIWRVSRKCFRAETIKRP